MASQSPRRRQLLEDAGYEFVVKPPDDEVENSADKDLSPNCLVVELARLKAQSVAANVAAGMILAADTIALCDGQILGKPQSRADANRMLRLMSGKSHRVLTGISLWHRPSDRHQEFLEVTGLRMDHLSDEQITTFLDSDGWQGKAGAFGYQDGLDWVHIETGLASNVVGLPVERLAAWIDVLQAERS